MSDGLKRVGTSVWKSQMGRELVREVGKMYVLLLGVGLLALVIYGASGYLDGIRDVGVYVQPSGFGWELAKASVYQEPAVGKLWWEISESEMNRNRVIYNWQTKPGLRLLSWQVLALMVGTGLILHKAKMWRVVSIGVRSNTKLKRREKRSVGSFSGVVEIRALRGVIYISGLPDIVVGMEELGLWLRPMVLDIRSSSSAPINRSYGRTR